MEATMIKPKYNHIEVEENQYQTWLEKGYFKSGDLSKEPFTIVIPPPNVTGKLHLGHAWDNTIQDILVRRKRMQGYDALYLPGMDHAGIATQAKIDAKLKSEGKNRYQMGRDAFLDEAWAWKESYAKTIRSQWEALGISVDYDKERFTMDEGLSKAVETVFIKLYEKGLIYRKERIINWDVQAKTALSNIEVERYDIEGALYTMRYITEDGSDELLIATTRPETMFADTAIMIHPSDKKRSHLLGKKVKIPGTSRLIPVIEDDYVDLEFGTGAVKVTPAHDPNDFIIGEKHGLDMPSCMHEDGTMNHLAGKYEGLDRFECRKQLVKDLKENGLMTDIEKIVHNVGHSERTGVIVEPRLSMQWFVKMDELASKALNESKASFVPSRFEKTFNHWMENIQDWCISRQLWWGHRIPAYYKEDEVYVGTNPPLGFVQDEDVLDTWFSSALWPFSTLGWPEETEDFKRYYPNNVMVTGYDIIFFWVARMIFQALEFTEKTPFEDVLIHGLIRDEQGRKMSKSLGNGIDPMDIKETYGIDTLRYFLTTNSAPGQDLRFEYEKVESSWNYINKLWNITRYVMMQTEDVTTLEVIKPSHFLNQMILSEFQKMLETVNQNYEKYELSEAAKSIYLFTWDLFASWYIEMTKPLLRDGSESLVNETKQVMAHILLNLLKLLHPFMPFVTEYLYQHLTYKDSDSIMISEWPKLDNRLINEDSENTFKLLESFIKGVRNIRNTHQVPPKKPIDMIIKTTSKDVFETHESMIQYFTSPKSMKFLDDYEPSSDDITLVEKAFTLIIPLGSLVDIKDEIIKQENALKKLDNEIKRAENMLKNPQFMNKAPESKIQEEQTKLKTYKKQYKDLNIILEGLRNRV